MTLLDASPHQCPSSTFGQLIRCAFSPAESSTAHQDVAYVARVFGPVLRVWVQPFVQGCIIPRAVVLDVCFGVLITFSNVFRQVDA